MGQLWKVSHNMYGKSPMIHGSDLVLHSKYVFYIVHEYCPSGIAVPSSVTACTD
jgi:hypothetical protein